jgi:hypothetical protein
MIDGAVAFGFSAMLFAIVLAFVVAYFWKDDDDL